MSNLLFYEIGALLLISTTLIPTQAQPDFPIRKTSYPQEAELLTSISQSTQAPLPTNPPVQETKYSSVAEQVVPSISLSSQTKPENSNINAKQILNVEQEPEGNLEDSEEDYEDYHCLVLQGGIHVEPPHGQSPLERYNRPILETNQQPQTHELVVPSMSPQSIRKSTENSNRYSEELSVEAVQDNQQARKCIDDEPKSKEDGEEDSEDVPPGETDDHPLHDFSFNTTVVNYFINRGETSIYQNSFLS